MNLPFIRNYSNLAHRILINHCQYKEKSRLLLCNNIKVHLIRSKTTNPTLYEIKRNAKKPISLYGYFLLVSNITNVFSFIIVHKELITHSTMDLRLYQFQHFFLVHGNYKDVNGS